MKSRLVRDVGGDEDSDDDEKVRAELNIVKSLLTFVSDGSPLVRAELAVAFARFAFGHNKHLKSIAAAYWKPQSNSLLSSLPSLANINGPGGYNGTGQYMQGGSSVPSQIGPVLRVGSDSTSVGRDGRVATSIPLATPGIMHGSPLSDDSSQHSDSGIMINDSASNGVISYSRQRPLDNGMYSHCVLAMCTLAKDPSPRIAGLGRRILSMIGIEQVIARTLRFGGSSVRQGDPTISSPSPNLAGLARSSSWFDMNAGHLPLTFRTPPVSPPRQNFLTGMRRVCSLEFRPHLLNSPDSGLADPLLGAASSGVSECSLLPQSTIYNWSCGHFSRPLLTAADDNEEILSKREQKEKLALDRIAKCQRSCE
ncbi:hypothetical protein IFM89_033125 [Coptis chinensis]|uniref:Uncharacterized protein n=1 Tax=Coptis chinensis TaxID=261450 RepID=A0A835LNF4_9MAGN|nr:hypothetical protein IFM89_033125 [Coptis chinensis]